MGETMINYVELEVNKYEALGRLAEMSDEAILDAWERAQQRDDFEDWRGRTPREVAEEAVETAYNGGAFSIIVKGTEIALGTVDCGNDDRDCWDEIELVGALGVTEDPDLSATK